MSTAGSRGLQAPGAGLPDARYAAVLADIKARVETARVRALRTANAELMHVYWHIGRHIGEQEDAAPVKRGRNSPKIVERLSADLRAAYPDATGFSARNLRYMRDFARAWSEEEILQCGVARLPWGHIVELLEVVSIPLLGEGLGVGGRTFLGDITQAREVVVCGGLGLAGAGRAVGGG